MTKRKMEDSEAAVDQPLKDQVSRVTKKTKKTPKGQSDGELVLFHNEDRSLVRQLDPHISFP